MNMRFSVFALFFALIGSASLVHGTSPMQTPTSSNYSNVSYGTYWKPSISVPPGNGSGDKVFVVAGKTNWRSSSWQTNQVGTFSFYVGQEADANHHGNVTDPLAGELQINGSPYTLTVVPAAMSNPTSSNYSNVAVGSGWKPSISASSNNGSGTKLFAVANHTNWQSGNWYPSSPGTYTFYVSQEADGNHFGNTNDPIKGDIHVNFSSYSVTVVAVDYSLTVVNGDGDGSYEEDEEVSISADNPSSNEVFDYWSKSGPGSLDDSNWHDTTFTMGTGNATVTAKYTEVDYDWSLPSSSVAHNATYNVGINVGTEGGFPYVTLRKESTVIAGSWYGTQANTSDDGPDDVDFSASYSDSVKSSSGSSGPETVEIDSPPPPCTPSLVSPSHTSVAQALDTEVEWSCSTSSTTFDVYFGTDSTPDSGEFRGNQSSKTYDHGTLLPNKTYYWQIKAKKNGITRSSSVWRFTTMGKPSNPVPSDNAVGQGINVNLNWSSANGATSYKVYFGTDSNPPLVATQSTIGYDPPDPLLPSTVYYWKIEAVGPNGNADGGVWSFTTVDPPLAPVADPATTVATTSFHANWTGTASSYLLDASEVQDFATFLSGYEAASVSGNSEVVVGLTSNTTYYYRLRSVENGVESIDSNVVSVTTGGGGGSGGGGSGGGGSGGGGSGGDSDGDGLLDSWEQQIVTHFGLSGISQVTASGDRDGDGKDNAAEHLDGLDPTKKDNPSLGLQVFASEG